MVDAVASEVVSGLRVPQNLEKQGIFAIFEPFRRMASAFSGAFSVGYAENSLRSKQGTSQAEQGNFVSVQGMHA